ncbi:MAG: thioredoxin domain-containing protein [Fuerstiella sp.]|nr:thioredoxin domain-containing protein [Fuerstiella sp.]
MFDLRALFHRSHPRRRLQTHNIQLRGSAMAAECLETRTLLAGNVLAAVSSGGDLVLTGDDQSNSVDLVVVNGDLVVRGRDDTTVNGAHTAFVASAASSTVTDDLFVQLGQGNDVLFIEGIMIAGRATVASQGGNDSIGFESTTVGTDLIIRTSNGADTVNVDGVTVNRDLRIRTGRHNDTVRIAGTSIADDLSIVTGRHNDAVVLDMVTVGDDAAVTTGHGADDTVMMSSTVGDRLRTRTRIGNDFVMIDATTVSGRARIHTQGHDDLVVIENASQFSHLRLNTGAGRDGAEVESSTVLSGRMRQRRMESGTVSAEDRARELNDPVTGALTLSNTADTFFNNLATVSEPLSLSLDVTSNEATQSNGTLVTNASGFRIDVITSAGAIVDVDVDGDGQFDDGSVVADNSGNATLNVTLTHDEANNGANTLNVRAINAQNDEVFESVNVHLSEGTVVRFDSTLGAWDVELLDTDAPNTVGAFLNNLSANNGSFSHRNIENFIIQGGGFTTSDGSTVQNVASFAAPPNEFSQASPLNSNVRGTLSTAQNSNINSFTGQWFINTVNNDGTGVTSNLDNVPHTVFGYVIGTGMTVVDAINNTPVFNLAGLVTNSSALTDVPLVNYTSGTVPEVANYVRFNSLTEIISPPGNENSFRVPENSNAGTSVGQIIPATLTGNSLIFEFDDPALPSELKLNPDDHLEGDAAAAVVLVEYLSLQCPSCAAGHPDVQQLLTNNPSDVVVVRRHLPLHTSTGGPFQHSFEAALAAEAAGRQGMFDQMVDQLFSRQSEWDNSFTSEQVQAVFEDIAVNTLGLNLTTFNADMSDQVLTDRVNRDIADAGALGVSGTPTFFLNGQVMSGTPTSSDVQNAVQTLNRTFALNRRTGDLTVVDSTDLDFETNPSFVLDVTVTNGVTETVQATVNVIDAFNG